jgi:hypothetical protein
MFLKLIIGLITFIFITPFNLYTQISIPGSRLGDWSNVGYRSTYPRTFGNTYTVNNTSSAAIDSVIDLARNDTSTFDKIELPAGDYYMDDPILLDVMCSRLVIQGMGTEPASVNLIFQGSISGDALIRISDTERVRNVILENLKISAGSVSSTNSIYNIVFVNAEDCLVKNIESHKPVKQHLAIGNSRNIEVRDSYFHEAHSYGGGGSGYGVCIAGGSMYCLIENNVFRHLRHAMVLTENVANNVFGYNFSFDQYSPPIIQGDICVHGDAVSGDGKGPGLGWPNRNLFEGNYVDRIWADDYHGKNGPYNTYFRNFSYYQFIKLEQDDSANVIGNEGVLDTDDVESIWETYGTKKDDQTAGSQYEWAESHDTTYYLVDISLYKKKRPDFISREFTWPPIGPPVGPESPTSSQNIPARRNVLAANPQYSSLGKRESKTGEMSAVGELSSDDINVSVNKAVLSDPWLVAFSGTETEEILPALPALNKASKENCNPLLYDINGDGRCDRLQIDLKTMRWFFHLAGKDGISREFEFGLTGDTPLVGDFDGDKRSDLCIFRESEALWSVRFTQKRAKQFKFKSGYERQWGSAGQPYTAKLGDFNGDGIADRFLYHGELKEWYVNLTHGEFDESTDLYLSGWGKSGDTPVIGDFNGDKLCDIARYNSGKLYIRLTRLNPDTRKHEFGGTVYTKIVASQ